MSFVISSEDRALSPRSTYTEKSDSLPRAWLHAGEEVLAHGLASEHRSGGNDYLRRDVKILEPLNFEELPREERAGGGIFTAGRRARLSRAWTERYFGLRSWP